MKLRMTLNSSPAAPREVPSTHWSVILAAAGDGPDSRSALAKLYELYNAAVLRFALRSRLGPSDAQEFTQQFFADLIARRDLQKLDPALGSFHAWLYRCLRNALLNARRRASCRPALLSREPVEPGLLPADDSDPEREFLRHCAHARYRKARDVTKAQLPRVNDLIFAVAIPDPAIPDPGSAIRDQAAIAQKLGIGHDAVRTRIKEVRIRFRANLLRQLLELSGPSNLAGELRALCEAFSETEPASQRS